MTPLKPTQTFTVQDPREFDGDAYQVAERAIQQLRALLALASDLIDPTTLMIRNADLERTLATGGKLGDVAVEWPESPLGKKVEQVERALALAQTDLQVLERAAGFNPKDPRYR